MTDYAKKLNVLEKQLIGKTLSKRRSLDVLALNFIFSLTFVKNDTIKKA